MRFSSFSSDSFTGALSATNTAVSWAMPWRTCVKRETPAAWRTTQRPASASRSGAGVALQASPPWSSRMKIVSPVGSVTGSLAKGVRRFWRLFSAQVQAAPLAVITEPKSGLASTLAQGSGVSCPPSSTITYSRPSRAKPP